MSARTTPLSVVPLPGYEGLYEITSDGQIFSLPRQVVRSGRAMRVGGRVLRPHRRAGGDYLHVTVSRDGVGKSHLVHHLVAAAFLGPRPGGMDICHDDGNSVNNSAINLRYDTRRSNSLDALRHGTHFNAGKTHCAQGHPFSPENTVARSGGGRTCRTCKSAEQRRRRARKKETKA